MNFSVIAGSLSLAIWLVPVGVRAANSDILSPLIMIDRRGQTLQLTIKEPTGSIGVYLQPDQSQTGQQYHASSGLKSLKVAYVPIATSFCQPNLAYKTINLSTPGGQLVDEVKFRLQGPYQGQAVCLIAEDRAGNQSHQSQVSNADQIPGLVTADRFKGLVAADLDSRAPFYLAASFDDQPPGLVVTRSGDLIMLVAADSNTGIKPTSWQYSLFDPNQGPVISCHEQAELFASDNLWHQVADLNAVGTDLVLTDRSLADGLELLANGRLQLRLNQDNRDQSLCLMVADNATNTILVTIDHLDSLEEGQFVHTNVDQTTLVVNQVWLKDYGADDIGADVPILSPHPGDQSQSPGIVYQFSDDRPQSKPTTA